MSSRNLARSRKFASTASILPERPVALEPATRFEIIGDFSATSLRLNTITIDGDAGDDTIDISSLGSAHRIVFKSNGGNDTIIGTLRPQDVIELPDGMTAADFTTSTDDNGVTTMTNGDHSITFTSRPVTGRRSVAAMMMMTMLLLKMMTTPARQ